MRFGGMRLMINNIERKDYACLGERTTCCVVTLKNGFEVTGSYTCKKDKIDNKEFREQMAFDVALQNLERREEKRKRVLASISY